MLANLQKPPRGQKTLEHRAKSAATAKHEQDEKKASKIRDKRQCRRPRCVYRRQNLTMHSAHLHHKGMGGDPKQIRTTRDQLITFCAFDHGIFDKGDLDVKPLTRRGADGPCEFFVTAPDGHGWISIGKETAVGILERSA